MLRGDRQGILRRRASGATAVRARRLAFRVVLGQLRGLLRRCRLPRGGAESARSRRQPHRQAIPRLLDRRLRRRCPCHGRPPRRPPGADRSFPGRLRRAAIPRKPRRPGGCPGGIGAAAGRAGPGDADLEPPPWVSMRSLPVGNLTGFIGTTPLVREHLFSAHTPDDTVESCAAQRATRGGASVAGRPAVPTGAEPRGSARRCWYSAPRTTAWSPTPRCAPRQRHTTPMRNSFPTWDTT